MNQLNKSNMSAIFEPPNSKFLQKPDQKRLNTTTINASAIESRYASQMPSSAFVSKERPKRLFGGLNRDFPSKQSPFLKHSKRHLGEISQPFFTPRQSVNHEEESTTKPDFARNTVNRVSLIGFNQQNTLRQRVNQSNLENHGQKSRFMKQKAEVQKSPDFGARSSSYSSLDESRVSKAESLNLKVMAPELNFLKTMKLHEKQVALTSTTAVLEELAARHSNIRTNDIALKNKYRMDDDNLVLTGIPSGHSQPAQYEFDPASILPSSQTLLPSDVLLEASRAPDNSTIFQGFLVDNVVYMVVNKKLFLWEIALTIHGITEHRSNRPRPPTDQNLSCKQFSSRIQQVQFVENYGKDFTPYLCVATQNDIEIVAFKKKKQQGAIEKLKYDLSVLVDSGFQPVPLDQAGEKVNCISQFKKNGRIFYSSHQTGNTQVKIKELQFESSNQSGVFAMLTSLLPFQTQASLNKRLKTSNVVDSNESFASRVYNSTLPTFLNFFAATTEIASFQFDTQRNVMYALCFDLRGSQRSCSFIQIYDLGSHGDEFKRVTTITQRQIVESMHRDINGQTSFMFDDHDSDRYRFKSIHPLVCSESHFEHLMIVTENGLRIGISFSETEDDYEGPNQRQQSLGQQFDYTYPPRFTSHWLITSVHATPSGEDAESVFALNPNFFKIANLTRRNPMNYRISPTYYFDGCLVFDQQSASDLSLVFLSSNQSLQANLREVTAEQRGLPMASEFNLKESIGILRLEESGSEQELQSVPEQVVAVEMVDRTQTLSDQMRIDVQRMLGYDKAVMLDQGWGITNQMCKVPIGVFEKQVYVPHSVVKVMTTKRVIEVIQMRPIDQLVGVLKSIVSQPGSKFDLTDFDDFMIKNTVLETCTMLLQIVSEAKDGFYASSNKLDRALVVSAQLRQKEQIIHQQSQVYQQPRQGIGSQMRSTLLTKSRYGRETILQEERDEITSDLLPFVLQHDEKVSNQCRYSKIDMIEVIDLARELLLIYGDSIKEAHTQEFIDFLNSQQIETITTDLTPRILRPIWETKLTHRKSLSDFSKQTPNIELFLPALLRLQNLYNFIEANFQRLTNQNSKEDQGQILNQQKYNEVQLGISNPQITSMIRFSYSFDMMFRDKIEALEKKTLTQLLFFLRRCIDVCEFIKIVSFENNVILFQDLLSQLKKDKRAGPKVLEEVADTCFRELVLEGTSEEQFVDEGGLVSGEVGSKKAAFINQLFQASVMVSNKIMNQNQQSKNLNDAQWFKQRVAQIQKVCPTLFCSSSQQTFVGLTLLQQAVKEKDTVKRQALVNDAISQLEKKPEVLNLKQVVPVLTKLNNFLTIVDLALRKSKYLQEVGGEEKQIKECFEVILDLFSALDQSIQEQQLNRILPPTGAQTRKPLPGFYMHFFECFMKDNLELQEKARLRKLVMDRVFSLNHSSMMGRQLFIYLVQQPTDIGSIVDLPELDEISFKEIVQETLLQSRSCSKEYLDTMVRLMTHDVYRASLKFLHCEVVLRVCDDDSFEIVKHGLRTAEKKGPERVYLTCAEKINYCLYAQDVLNEISNSPIEDQDQVHHYLGHLNSNISHLRFQQKVQESIGVRLAYLKEQQARYSHSPEKQKKLQVQIEQVEQAIKLSSVRKMEMETLHTFISDLNLWELNLESLADDYEYSQKLRMANSSYQADLERIQDAFLEVFKRMFKEMDELEPQNRFKALLVLSMYTRKEKVLEEAVRYLIETVEEEVKAVGALKLADTMRRVADGVRLVDCECFDFIGYLFVTMSSETALQPLVGSTVYRIASELLSNSIQSGDITFYLTLTLLIIHEWLKVLTLSAQQQADEFQKTKQLLPEAFGPSEPSQEYQRDLMANLPRIRDQLLRTDKLIKENSLTWIREYELAARDLFTKVDSDLAIILPRTVVVSNPMI